MVGHCNEVPLISTVSVPVHTSSVCYSCINSLSDQANPPSVSFGNDYAGVHSLSTFA